MVTPISSPAGTPGASRQSAPETAPQTGIGSLAAGAKLYAQTDIIKFRGGRIRQGEEIPAWFPPHEIPALMESGAIASTPIESRRPSHMWEMQFRAEFPAPLPTHYARRVIACGLHTVLPGQPLPEDFPNPARCSLIASGDVGTGLTTASNARNGAVVVHPDDGTFLGTH
jgi:hypothetical protein